MGITVYHQHTLPALCSSLYWPRNRSYNLSIDPKTHNMCDSMMSWWTNVQTEFAILNRLMCVVVIFRTPTRGIWSPTCTRACWPKLLSPRRQRKGKAAIFLPFYFNRFKLKWDTLPFLIFLLSACFHSWGASGTPAPPLLRPPLMWQKRTDRPREPGRGVPTLQPAPMSEGSGSHSHLHSPPYCISWHSFPLIPVNVPRVRISGC